MSRPDIIFLVLDTQRADRLGCYGHHSATTDNLDSFAGQAALFEQAVSPAQWTIPSHASMFTGLYPTSHQVTQSDQLLGDDLPHLVEALNIAGYETIGFCNNPLVGVLNNGFKRGFDTFYNYGGAIPSLPKHSSSLPGPLGGLAEVYTQFLRRISYPIQNFFGQSNLAFRLSLNAWFTPLWSRFANFKGQNARSIRDMATFLRQRESRGEQRPLFLFVNLMETHLPFWPPGRYVERHLPYYDRSKEARSIMRRWNREAYRWAVPLAQPLPELEAQILSDMYDAEVAYQDDYLGEFFSTLAARVNHENTLTIIVGDHGDGLGEHNHMGHAFVAYQELSHVPLILHWPAQIFPGERVKQPVSTRRVYHTMLDGVGRFPERLAHIDRSEVQQLSLLNNLRGPDPEAERAMIEVYPPLNLIRAIERREPALMAQYRPEATRRALVKAGHKLIQVNGEDAELYDLTSDPEELQNKLGAQPETAAAMRRELDQVIRFAERRKGSAPAEAVLDLEGDTQLLQRLRSLGYIE